MKGLLRISRFGVVQAIDNRHFGLQNNKPDLVSRACHLHNDPVSSLKIPVALSATGIVEYCLINVLTKLFADHRMAFSALFSRHQSVGVVLLSLWTAGDQAGLDRAFS